MGPLLQGALNADATRRAMDHLRTCDDCRNRLEFQRNAVTNSAVEDVAESLRYQRYSYEEVMEAKTGRSPHRARGLMALVMIFLLVGFAVRSRFLGDEVPIDHEPDAALAIDAGLVALMHPEGDLAGRPRVVSGWLPLGASKLNLRLSSGGQMITEWTVTPEDPGVVLIAKKLQGPEGAIEGLRMTAPFPSAGELALDLEKSYELRGIIEGGAPGNAVTFTIRKQ